MEPIRTGDGDRRVRPVGRGRSEGEIDSSFACTLLKMFRSRPGACHMRLCWRRLVTAEGRCRAGQPRRSRTAAGADCVPAGTGFSLWGDVDEPRRAADEGSAERRRRTGPCACRRRDPGRSHGICAVTGTRAAGPKICTSARMLTSFEPSRRCSSALLPPITAATRLAVTVPACGFQLEAFGLPSRAGYTANRPSPSSGGVAVMFSTNRSGRSPESAWSRSAVVVTADLQRAHCVVSQRPTSRRSNRSPGGVEGFEGGDRHEVPEKGRVHAAVAAAERAGLRATS